VVSQNLARFQSLRMGQFGGFASDSFYTGAWLASVSVADLLQLALLTHALGLAGYGRLALVIAFVTLASQFFDVRMTTAATAFAAAKIPASFRSAAGIFQFSYLVDGLAGAIGFLFVIALAPVVGPHLAGKEGAQAAVLFGLTFLVGSLDDTSITILRLVDRFRLATVCGIVSEILRVLFVWLVLEWSRDLRLVFAALIAYSAVRASINLMAATSAFRRASHGISLFHPVLGEIRNERRAMVSMIFHTNIASYARLATTQLPTLLLGAISGVTEVGIYKVGMAAAAAVGRLADPAVSAILPRVAKLWSAGRRAEIGRLIRQGTLLVAGITAAGVALTIAFRKPFIDLITGGPYSAGIGVVLIVGVAGQAVNGVLFWNGQVLFAAGRARAVAIVLVIGAALQITIIAALAPSFGAKGASFAFLLAQLVINIGLTVIAVRLLARPPLPDSRSETVPPTADSSVEHVVLR
jgi:O-antigen/teichoic acid export membrane protein